HRLAPVAAVGLMLLAGIITAGFRAPAWGDEQPLKISIAQNPPADQEPAAQATDLQEPAAQATALDDIAPLAYVPESAPLVITVRVADLLNQPALKPAAEIVSGEIDRDFRKMFGVSLADVDRITWYFQFDENARLTGDIDGVVIRTNSPIEKVISRNQNDEGKEESDGQSAPPEKRQFATRTYYAREGGELPFFFVAGPQTLVATRSENALRALIVTAALNGSSSRWGNLWETIADDQLAVLADLSTLGDVLEPEIRGKDDFLMLMPFSPLWRETKIAAAGVKIADKPSVHVTAICDGPTEAERVAETLRAAVVLGKNSLEELKRSARQAGGEQATLMLLLMRAAEDMLTHLEITQEQETVTASTSADAQAALVLAVLMPAVESARQAARRTQATNNLRQIGLALHNYHDVHGRFPPAVVMGPDGKTPHSWRVEILPFLDAVRLYEQYRMDEPWDGEHNKQLIEKMPAVFRSPAATDGKPGIPSYFALVGQGTVFDASKTAPADADALFSGEATEGGFGDGVAGAPFDGSKGVQM
ncbi:MAG: DUF1559 domain-containing protein, partial [Planctomycetaceae bacterium]